MSTVYDANSKNGQIFNLKPHQNLETDLKDL